MRRVMVLLAVMLVLGSSLYAFDGNRKGFVLGGGLGFGYAKVSLSGYSGTDINKSGAGLNFIIGYAWDEQNMIVFLRDGVIYSAGTIYGGSISLVQGFSGIGYYHYFGPVGKSFFINGGLGLQDWTALESGYTNPDPGFGLLLGLGYEFTRHVQVNSNISFGKTSEFAFFSNIDYDHVQFTIEISAVAF